MNIIAEYTGNVIKVLHDENNIVTLIYVQLQQQRELYKKNGEVLMLDGTYNIWKSKKPLFTMLVEDSFGIGQLVAYFFVKEETTASIMDGLELFKLV